MSTDTNQYSLLILFISLTLSTQKNESVLDNSMKQWMNVMAFSFNYITLDWETLIFFFFLKFWTITEVIHDPQ